MMTRVILTAVTLALLSCGMFGSEPKLTASEATGIAESKDMLSAHTWTVISDRLLDIRKQIMVGGSAIHLNVLVRH